MTAPLDLAAPRIDTGACEHCEHRQECAARVALRLWPRCAIPFQEEIDRAVALGWDGPMPKPLATERKRTPMLSVAGVPTACLRCGSDKIKRDGKQYRKYGVTQNWYCKACKRRFTQRPEETP